MTAVKLYGSIVQIHTLKRQPQNAGADCNAAATMQSSSALRLTHRGESADTRLQALAIQPRLLIIIPAASADERLQRAPRRLCEGHKMCWCKINCALSSVTPAALDSSA